MSDGYVEQIDGNAQPAKLTPGRALGYLVIGIYFGIVLVKAEVVSWFRIQEMFHFMSIHMYGIMGLAVVTGALSVLILKALQLSSLDGVRINPARKPFNKVANPVGGLLFGFGWALTGACPGPLYATLGAGYLPILIAIAGAFLGVVSYGYLKPKLPH